MTERTRRSMEDVDLAIQLINHVQQDLSAEIQVLGKEGCLKLLKDADEALGRAKNTINHAQCMARAHIDNL